MLSRLAGRAVSTAVYIVPLSSVVVQQRAFRANRPFTQGGAQARNADETRNPLETLLRKFTDMRPASDQQRLGDFKSRTSKLSDAEARQFSEGYVQALLTAQSQQGAPKKFRVFRFIGGTILLAWIGYNLVMILLSDKKSGLHFIFSHPQEVKPEQVHVTFDDVRGMDEAKSEVTEIVNYLRDPEHYSRLGGRLPKGVLLVGPPGTGKTLLARAIAGEAGVPFFHTSGSEFDEVLVGQGARRVRDLFERAKQKAPCIVFIDEIDSVGSKRVTSSIHPYANQTINQLLNEMDGFEQNEGVIVVGATNRIEDLDKALLRPGRFDVQVHVQVPDLAGRVDIFLLYLSRIVHDKMVVSQLAKGTTGFTGADIENMCNQAALKAASDGSTRVAMRHLEEARDRILMGPARAKGRFPDEEANRNTAWHEAGHTLVAYYTKDATPLHKVTIIPRGGSLGHTSFLPEKDSVQVTRSQMLAQLDVMMGGRVAEELTFGMDKVTTGASDDLRKATELAVTMVKRLGMSEQSGLRDYTIDVDNSGRDALVKISERSQRMNETLDTEIERMLKESYNRAKGILTEHAKEHKALAEALFEYETLNAEEVHTIVNGGSIERTFTQPPLAPRDGKKRRTRPAMIEIQVD